MSDYDVSESSVDDGQPYELYRFVTPSKSFYYTTDSVAHVLDSKNYVPIEGLKRSSISIATHEDSDSSFSVQMPIFTELAKSYALAVTPPSLKLTIFRFHRNASSYTIPFDGDINSVTTKGNWSTFKAMSDFGGIMSSQFPTLVIQPPCNNVLFDTKCKVSRSANQYGVEVFVIDGKNIRLANIGGFPSTWFIGGEMVFGVEHRSIVSQSGVDFVINYPFANPPEVGQLVTIAAGCDHGYSSATGCPKFSNQVNFGGFPFAPGESNNPFSAGV